ncbi:GNAT family N-acetyltransferase [Flavobacterium pallidum]|uniref:N-acetyltransferase n=1 Tax=Flavobacterium pallidum TaxID=2172098 RepID=A0A2S1SKQ7_9FLAO|nr:GNAT family protein [Flavobacterium pallidum]AWI26993.1 N-acetyltransferase [Flavobacterium pallidum]
MNDDFDFNQELVLEDERVMLRPLQFSDVGNLLYFSENEPDIWHFSLIRANGRINLEHYINIALNARGNKSEFPFIVFDKKTGKYAGSTRFYDIQFPLATLQLGYTWYGKEFQGTGLNKHCKYLLLRYAFETLGMERVEFRADNNNARSIAAMKSIGCKVDGILRSNMPTAEGGRRDSILLSILKREWHEGVKQKIYNSL